jgi:nitrite reductase (NADH) small subunit
LSERISAGSATDLKPGETRRVEIEDDTVCIYNVEGTLYAVSNICPHAGAALHHGFIENGRVTCPWHSWSFPLSCEETLRDGLYRYRLHEEDGRLYIETPAVNA